MDEFEIELKEDFLEESVDLLEKAEQAFLDLEDNRDDPELINSIFRLAHNLKGTSRAVGFEQLAELTHIAENLILKIKEGEIKVTDPIVTGLLSFKDKVEEMVNGLREDLDARFELTDVIDILNKLTSGSSDDLPQSDEPSVSEVEVMTEEPLVEEEIEVPSIEAFEEEESSAEEKPVVMSQAAIDSMAELGLDISNMVAEEESPPEEGVLNFKNIAKEKEVIAPAPEEKVIEKVKPKTASKKSDEDESIRVKLSRIDQINNIVGELVILQTVINQRRYEYIKDDLSNNSIGQMSKLFKEAQELAMSLRMLPLKATFQKMNRIVRDTSKALSKEVNLIIEGEDTEVDKTILEQIADPLVHIIRNAVDHGLESSETRLESGKDKKGNVWLRAFHEGSNLVIEVRDDGKGIPPDIIRRKAIENKVITENQEISEYELINLIFHPGFSTKEEVTEVSGRGVGMDVVKTNIEGLGGEVGVTSILGSGSTFKIILPLTLAIIDGLVIKSDDQRYVIPLGQVFEVITLNKEDITAFSGGGNLFTLRGEVLPLFALNKKLGKKYETSEKNTVIVLRGLDYSIGVCVDSILNQQQIVIKQLGDDIRATKGMMGSAILGDGQPAFIIDLFETFKSDMKKSEAYKELMSDMSISA